MSLDLAPEDLKTVIAILHRHIPECEVLAFGSRVNGKSKKFSDLDLALLSSKPVPIKTMALMKEDFSESNLPFKVDLVDWNFISEEFRKVIQKENLKIV